jgi:hypothetical protein
MVEPLFSSTPPGPNIVVYPIQIFGEFEKHAVFSGSFNIVGAGGTGGTGGTGGAGGTGGTGTPVLTCSSIGALYVSSAGSATSELLTKDCKAIMVSQLPISPTQISPGALPATVTLSASQITSGALPATVTLSASQITSGALPATVTLSASQITSGSLPASVTVPLSSLPPTTNTLAYDATAKTLTSTVNGVAASVAISNSVALIDAAYTAAPVAPTDTKFVYGANGEKFKLKQNKSSTGLPLGTWSLVA